MPQWRRIRILLRILQSLAAFTAMPATSTFTSMSWPPASSREQAVISPRMRCLFAASMPCRLLRAVARTPRAWRPATATLPRGHPTRAARAQAQQEAAPPAWQVACGATEPLPSLPRLRGRMPPAAHADADLLQSPRQIRDHVLVAARL